MKTLLMALTILTPGQEGDDLTPAQALKLMEEALQQMGKAEALLNEEKAGKAEERERAAARALEELLKKSRASDGRGRDSQRNRPPETPKRPPTGGKAEEKRPDGAPSKFQKPSGSWGLLPPDVLRAMRASGVNEVPAQFREWWSRYFKAVSGGR